MDFCDRQAALAALGLPHFCDYDPATALMYENSLRALLE